MVEMFDLIVGQPLLERLHKHEIFARRDRHMGRAKRGEEGQEHQPIKPDRRRGAKENFREATPVRENA